MQEQQAYGTWKSPITASMVTTAGVRLGDIAFQGDTAFWAEARPEDNGRTTIVKAGLDSVMCDLTSVPFNPRTRVHEYGGGSWWVNDKYLYFAHWDDQRLYRVDHINGQNNTPQPVTPEPDIAQGLRYADGCVSPDGQWIVCVRESHDATSANVHNEIVAIRNAVVADASDAAGNAQSTNIKVLVSGADFYSTPRLSPDGQHLSWIQWTHPQMPWDGTQLMLANVQSGDISIHNIEKITGNIETSVMGAMWTSAGELVYASDESGWWNIYQYSSDAQTIKQLTRFTDREVGVPAWIFGTQRFVELVDIESASDVNKFSTAQSSSVQSSKSQFSNEKSSTKANTVRLALVVTHNARDQLQVLHSDGQIVPIESPYTSISHIAADADGRVLIQGQAEDQQASIGVVDCRAQSESEQSPLLMLKAAAPLTMNSAWLSAPQAINYRSGDHSAHAFFYPPTAPDIACLPDELPPLVVMGHGGPTSHATAGLKLAIQFWTSRGIAVVDVNYGGSSGFGRDYRRLLNGGWGIVDVQDCISAAQYLADNGHVDPARMVIRGGSAGGLTVLRALQTSDNFAGGTSLYGVTDLELLAGDTHKFESRYLDGLLGGPYPEHKATYVERSPIHHTDQLSCPILVLQGDEDKVVPPNQSAAIVKAAAAKGLPHAYVLFEGEQHGFRKTNNVIRALQLELWFYGRVLGFVPFDDIDAPPEAVGL